VKAEHAVTTAVAFAALMVIVSFVFWPPGDLHDAPAPYIPLEASPVIELGDGMRLEPAVQHFHQQEVRNGDTVTFFSLRHLETTDEYEVTVFAGTAGAPRCESIHSPKLHHRFTDRATALNAVRDIWRDNRQLGPDRLAGWRQEFEDAHVSPQLQ
jgi:hypothetical protein